jgi:outer membrane protein TolC
VTLPIFDRLVNYSNGRSSAYLREAAQSAQVQVERAAQSESEASRSSFEISVRSAVAREKTLVMARRLYQDSLQRLQAGRSSSNDVLVDETRATTAENLANQGWASAHLAWIRLCHGVGLRLDACLKL